MKKYLCLMVVLLGSSTVFAQTSFELNMRYSHYFDKASYATNGGHFSLYALEMHNEAKIKDWLSVYSAFNLNDGESPELEDTFLDIHVPGGTPVAFRGTGVRIGNIIAPFGFGDSDSEGTTGEGRTAQLIPLIRSLRADGQRLRMRMVGAQGIYNTKASGLGATVLSLGVFNGPIYASGGLNGYDNDSELDYITRAEQTIDSLKLLIGASYWNAPKTVGATTKITDTTHPRDISRIGVHFKYPSDVPFPGEDCTIAGAPFHFYGEYITGKNTGNPAAATTYTSDLNWNGYYLEGAFTLVKKTIIGFARYDYVDPDTSVDGDHYRDIVTGLIFPIEGQTKVTVEYQKNLNMNPANDGIFAGMQIYF